MLYCIDRCFKAKRKQRSSPSQSRTTTPPHVCVCVLRTVLYIRQKNCRRKSTAWQFVVLILEPSRCFSFTCRLPLLLCAILKINKLTRCSWFFLAQLPPRGGPRYQRRSHLRGGSVCQWYSLKLSSFDRCSVNLRIARHPTVACICRDAPAASRWDAMSPVCWM